MNKLLVFLWFLAQTHTVFSQAPEKLQVSFSPVFGNDLLDLESAAYSLENGSPVNVAVLRFYVSGLQLYQDNRLVYEAKNRCHLIDAADKNTLAFQLELPVSIAYNKIKFNLGIDSLTNVSGAMGGDLDPTKGMYWTWQSGYINFKLEGSSPLCKTRNNEFVFHLGGYQKPFNALKTVSFCVKKGEPVHIGFDVKKLLEAIDLSSQNHIMSPNAGAVKLAGMAAGCFFLQPL